MLDLTKPVQTRDGRQVRILCTDAKTKFLGKDYPVLGLVMSDDNKHEWHYYWSLTGDNGNGDPSADLINVPTKRRVTGWLNVYPESIRPIDPVHFHISRTSADQNTSASRIACIPISIEYTEGDGLDGAA